LRRTNAMARDEWKGPLELDMTRRWRENLSSKAAFVWTRAPSM
jgi:hypothetical protein